GEQAVAVQQGQQRIDAGGRERKLELDLSAAVVFRHGGQRGAFGQGGGEGVADHGGDDGDALLHVLGCVTSLAQGVGDLLVLAFRSVVAGAPALPGGEISVFEHFVQHHAEAGAAELAVGVGEFDGGGIRVHVRLVAAAGGGLGGGAGGVVAALGAGELGEAVDPPVAGERAPGGAGGGHFFRQLGAEPGQVTRRHGVVDGDGIGHARGQLFRVADHLAQRRLRAGVEVAGGQPQG